MPIFILLKLQCQKCIHPQFCHDHFDVNVSVNALFIVEVHLAIKLQLWSKVVVKVAGVSSLHI